MKIQIKGRDPFWARAFHVEWEDQFPGLKLIEIGGGLYSADEAWLDDLCRVGAETHCQILRAPDNPERRNWLSSLVPPLGGKKER